MADNSVTFSNTLMQPCGKCILESTSEARGLGSRYRLPAARNLERSRIAQLSQNEWVLRGQNLLITGPCDCGKTYVGCALGNNVYEQGYSVQYWRLSRLLGELTNSRANGSYRKQLTQFCSWATGA